MCCPFRVYSACDSGEFRCRRYRGVVISLTDAKPSNNIGVKRGAKEEAVVKQLVHQLGPKTKLDKLIMAN